MEKVGFGVIGYGIWGSFHARVYAQEDNSQLIAVCDIDEERARQIAEKTGAKRYYTDFKKLVQDPDIGAVSIVTPDFAHLEPAIAAIKARKHILIEKPLATTVEEAEKIVNEAASAGTKLMVDFHNRWNPCLMNIKNALDKRELGTLSLAYLRQSNPRRVPLEWLSWSGKSSVAWFLGSHTIDVARWLFNDK